MAIKEIPAPGEPILLAEFLLEDLMRSGVYFLFHNGELVYIGQTKTIKWRLDQHLAERRKDFDAIAFIPCGLDRLLEIEAFYIKRYAPKYNACGIARLARDSGQARQHHYVPGIDLSAPCLHDTDMTVYDVAGFLSVSEDWIIHWRDLGILPNLEMGTVLKFVEICYPTIMDARGHPCKQAA